MCETEKAVNEFIDLCNSDKEPEKLSGRFESYHDVTVHDDGSETWYYIGD